MKPPRSKLRGITRKGIVCETPWFLTLFPLQGNLEASSEESPDLFLGEEENSSILKKWFSGDIVENRDARDAADKFVNQDLSIIGAQIAFKEAKAHMYRILSLYTHNTYAALLDSYDVYHKDFDFGKISGFHY